jgi:hypothetical protein
MAIKDEQWQLFNQQNERDDLGNINKTLSCWKIQLRHYNDGED